MDKKLSDGQMKVLSRSLEKARKDKHLERCRERLGKIIEKKIKTTFIGAIVAMEDFFGFLWGHDSDEPLTQEQLEFLDLWEDARTKILDNGNMQIRGVYEELENHTVEWNRHNMNFGIEEN